MRRRRPRRPLAEADPDLCGWTLGPRLNAAGRMTHADAALRLLLTRDEAEAAALAAELEELGVLDLRPAA